MGSHGADNLQVPGNPGTNGKQITRPAYTPYPYVNDVLQLLLDNVREVLRKNYYGMYLYGSLAAGDFNPGSSDIDCLVVTNKELPKTIIPKLKAMHRRIWDSGLPWVEKLEVNYLPRQALQRYDPEAPPRPCTTEGKFIICGPEIHWVINRHILREHEVIIDGPPIRLMMEPVSADDLRKTVASILLDYWERIKNDSSWIEPPGHQPYVVLTCCRALHTLKTGKIVSKQVSARWTLKNIEKHWHGLINEALEWHRGVPQGDIEKTIELIGYTIDRAREYRATLPGSL